MTRPEETPPEETPPEVTRPEETPPHVPAAPGTTRPTLVPAADPKALEFAAAALAAGKVVAIPTDTVYGLGASIHRPEGMAAVFRAKGRPDGLALPVVVGRWRQAKQVAAQWPTSASQLAARFWPGALTVVVPVNPALGRHLGGGGATVGLREPDHRFVRALCRLAGPIALTSANRHREPPCTTAEAVRAAFGADDVALVVDGGICDGAPSTVVDCTVSPPACLRAGAIDWSWIEASLR